MSGFATYEVDFGSGRTVRVRAELPGCGHLDQISDATPRASGCEECLEVGDRWVHLRLCLSCGHVGCCDSSKNRHATRHHGATGHPIVQSFEPDEDWMYCYADGAFMEPVHDG